jgi:hypothetical protein
VTPSRIRAYIERTPRPEKIILILLVAVLAHGAMAAVAAGIYAVLS